MNTISIERGTTRMIAHKGLSSIETENTAAAFIAAGNRSYFGMETDIYVTKDRQVAVIHDDTTGALSPVDLVVEESTLEELKSIILYDLHTGQTRSDLRIPSLEEYIGICKKYDKWAIIEIKNLSPAEDIALIVERVGMLDYLEKSIFISSYWENLVEVKKIRPEQKAQFLEICDDELLKKLIEYKIDLGTLARVITKEFVDEMHGFGIEINAVVIDDPKEAERLVACGVDYITTNRLE